MHTLIQKIRFAIRQAARTAARREKEEELGQAIRAAGLAMIAPKPSRAERFLLSLLGIF
jgi:hypothetical protein